MQPTVSGPGPAWWWWTASAPASGSGTSGSGNSGNRHSTNSRRRVRILHLPRSGLAVTLYTPDQIRHIIRLENSVHRVTDVPWASQEHWPIQDFLQNVRAGRPPYTGISGAPSGSHSGSAGDTLEEGGGWEGTLRGWAAGALLLAAVLLLVRALERCLHRKLFKGQSGLEEWSTPTVRATSGDYLPNREGDDLPPPYATVTSTSHDKPAEEPPPPYSACFFANPKDMPTVHFYRRRDANIEAGQSSVNADDNAELKVEEETVQEERVHCEISVCDERSMNETRSDQSSDITQDLRNNASDNAHRQTSNAVYNV